MTPTAGDDGEDGDGEDDEDFADRVAAVGDVSADGEHLVSVTVPPDEAVEAVQEAVEADRAEAEFLGSEVPEPRREALERARRRLDEFNATPEHGLAVYAGVVEGDLVDYVFDDPPEPIAERVYAHGNEFETDPLDAPGHDEGTWGLLVVERGEAVVGRYDGEVSVAATVEADLPGKTAVDGHSEDTAESRQEEQVSDFFDEVAETARRVFLAGGADPGRTGEEGAEIPDGADGEGNVEGLLLGGSEVTAERFREGGHLDPRLSDAVAGTYAVEYASAQGLRRLVAAASEPDGPLAVDAEAREALTAFLDALAEGEGDDGDERAVYSPEATDEALTYDAVETLLVSADRPEEERRELRERAEAQGGECVVVPADFPDGERFAEAFDGVGALLRFPIE